MLSRALSERDIQAIVDMAIEEPSRWEDTEKAESGKKPEQSKASGRKSYDRRLRARIARAVEHLIVPEKGQGDPLVYRQLLAPGILFTPPAA